MIERIAVYESGGVDPYRNLALEQHLHETAFGGCCLLYLWQNQNTVVIGRNQNAWAECRTALLASERGRLARRLSGGGAVYHDLGNLNFTFLMRTEDYDLNKQQAVIRAACRHFGVETEVSGRNDLTAEGRKFSGNAFYHHDGRSYHHGTLLVDVDTDRMTRYLSPSKAKLSHKGVESVRARVVNLAELNPEITVSRLKAAMKDAFSEVYGLPLALHTAIDEERVDALTRHYASDAWLFGQKLPFTLRCEQRFSWGGVELQLSIGHGVITDARVYTDAMDEAFAPKLMTALLGCHLKTDAIQDALRRTDLSTEQQAELLTLFAAVL